MRVIRGVILSLSVWVGGCMPRTILPDATPVTAFANVTVITMKRPEPRRGQILLVRGGKIVALGSARRIRVPANAQVIDGAGRFLMPGLADMHVHIFHEDELILYLANGVTTVRNMWGMPFHLKMRQRVEAGELAGPSIFTAGAIIDGDPPQLRGSAVVRTRSEADSVVAQQLRDGYDFVKVYNRLTPEMYDAVVAAADGKMFVAGHVPARVGLLRALSARQRSIEHLAGYVAASMTVDTGAASWGRTLDISKLQTVAIAARKAGTWNTPTLLVSHLGELSATESREFLKRDELRFLPPTIRQFCCRRPNNPANDLDGAERALRQKNRFMVVNALGLAGAPLLVGTDTGNPFVLPGFSLPDELALLVRAGLTPYEALYWATAGAAKFLLGTGRSGTIAVGERADMILLHGNPLIDIDAVRFPEGVMANGKWFPRSELDRRMEAQSAKYQMQAGSRPP